ncbi:hypothetical protein KX816_03810 [Sphingosinicellaceae bacterium]|nr:hypothetical protein KX816_03810 [Sphingosinicellaceae bacterium]
MGDTDTAPDKTDTGWFNDADQLTDFMADHRIGDTTMRSSFEDAQAIIATFADSTETGAWASLDRATVAERLKGLFAPTTAADIGSGYRSIDQGALNLCGPAALLVMAIGRDPVAVAHYATDLFDTGSGSIGNFTVTASDDLRAADFADLETHGRIASQAEWMMLGAIRNTLQPFWQPDWNGDPDQLLAGMTRPEEIADWMRQTGIWTTVEDNGRWASNPGIPNATDLSVAEGTDTAMLIHANLLKESETVGAIDGPAAHNWSPLEYFPNHWVVLLSEITPSVDGETMEFTVWTWASRVRLKTPKQVFLDNYFGTISASQ